MLVDIVSNPIWLVQIRGLVIMAKLVLLALLVLLLLARARLLLLLLLLRGFAPAAARRRCAAQQQGEGGGSTAWRRRRQLQGCQQHRRPAPAVRAAAWGWDGGDSCRSSRCAGPRPGRERWRPAGS